MTATFIVGRTDLRRTQWQEQPLVPLADGEVRLRIDRFALTSNNITYAAFGEGDELLELLPDRRRSHRLHPGVGLRRRGRLALRRRRGRANASTATSRSPTTLVLHARARRPRAASTTARRTGASCSPSTTSTCAAAATPRYGPTPRTYQALLRPLFTTSFLIDDFLADNGFFGAREVLVSSASSKTAYGTAFCLRPRDAAAACRASA